MAEETIDPKLMGDPVKVIHYMDFQENPVKDNSLYIPDLVPGTLQPLEVYEEDGISNEILLKIDIEAIVKELEGMTGTSSDKKLDKQLKRFPEPTTKEDLSNAMKKSYAESTR